MPIGVLLELMSNIQDLRFVEVGADNLHAHGHAIGHAYRDRGGWKSGEVDGDSVDVFEIHRDRVALGA